MLHPTPRPGTRVLAPALHRPALRLGQAVCRNPWAAHALPVQVLGVENARLACYTRCGCRTACWMVRADAYHAWLHISHTADPAHLGDIAAALDAARRQCAPAPRAPASLQAALVAHQLAGCPCEAAHALHAFRYLALVQCALDQLFDALAERAQAEARWGRWRFTRLTADRLRPTQLVARGDVTYRLPLPQTTWTITNHPPPRWRTLVALYRAARAARAALAP